MIRPEVRGLLSASERYLIIGVSGMALFSLGYLFYKSAPIAAAAALLSGFAPREYARRRRQARKELLRQHFRQMLQSLSASLSAGKSLENAFRAAASDLRLMYPDGRIELIEELDALIVRLDNGDTLERALLDLAERADVDDITQFAHIVTVGKRTGGDLVEVVRRTSDTIGDKLEIQQDIAVMVANKRFEARALCAVPPMIIAFLAFGSPEYMEPLYTKGGRWVMSLAGLGMLGCVWWMHSLFRFRI